MIGEIYVATALAIFLALFGWSDKIFGLSNKNTQSILTFCAKAKLEYKSYLELMSLISKDKKLHPGTFQKKLVGILSKSNIELEDKPIMKILEENGLLIKSLDSQNKYKKSFFVILFIFLFVGGTILFYFEYSQLYVLQSVVISQAILLILIFVGALIYSTVTRTEEKIQKNLNSLTTKIGSRKIGR